MASPNKQPFGGCNKVVTETPLLNGEKAQHAALSPDKIGYQFYSNRNDTHDTKRRGERVGLMFHFGAMTSQTTINGLLRRIQPCLFGIKTMMTAVLHERPMDNDTHTPDDWNSLAVDVPQPLRGRYVTNPLARAMQHEQALGRRVSTPLTAMPTSGTLLPKPSVSSLPTESSRMISPIAPKKALSEKALTASDLSPVMPLRPESLAVERFQELEELSPMALMWQLVKDALGLRSEMASVRPPSYEAFITPTVESTYQIPPFKVRLQQRVHSLKESGNAELSTTENPFAVLPLQWASAPPLQRVVRQQASQEVPQDDPLSQE